MEFNTGHSLVFAVLMLNESPRQQVDRADLGCPRGLLVPQHLEVVLEDVDELVALEGLLDAVGHPVDELVELLGDVLVLLC
jgi:hypothetical protein